MNKMFGGQLYQELCCPQSGQSTIGTQSNKGVKENFIVTQINILLEEKLSTTESLISMIAKICHKGFRYLIIDEEYFNRMTEVSSAITSKIYMKLTITALVTTMHHITKATTHDLMRGQVNMNQEVVPTMRLHNMNEGIAN
mmetsp:Transcript_7429/g.15325  ORF Transcript_7429/g.15325 Transcript_7429/m.15325 type:complete len:141 (+) Transcript_7429:140-562(+)